VLGGGEPHLMVTDPPYGIEYDAGWRASAPITRRRTDGVREVVGGRAIGKVKNDDRADWGEAWVLFPGDVAYVWHASTHVSEVQDSLLSAGFVVRAHLIWAKSVMVIGRGHYHYQHEPCWYAVRKGKTAHWAGDRTQTTVWQIDKNQSSETGHSTQKPVECMRLIGWKTIRIAQGFARFQSPRDGLDEADLTLANLKGLVPVS
jgi:DNA modification methylase